MNLFNVTELYQRVQSLDGGFRFADENSSFSTTSYSKYILCAQAGSNCYKNPSFISLGKTLITCLGIDSTLSTLPVALKDLASEQVKSSAQKALLAFFSLFEPLPLNIPASLTEPIPFDFVAALHLGVFGVLGTFFYATSSNPKAEQRNEATLMGAALGAAAAWALNENFYLGAMSGAIGGFVTDGVISRALSLIPEALPLSAMLHSIQTTFLPLTRQRWDLIGSAAAGLLAASAYDSIRQPEIGKEATLFVGMAASALVFSTFSHLILPSLRKSQEILSWSLETVPFAASTLWIGRAFSLSISALSEQIESILTETCPNKNI